MTFLRSRSRLHVPLFLGTAIGMSLLAGTPAQAHPHSSAQTCVMVVPSTGLDDNPARQEKPIRMCIPTKDIPAGMPGAQAQAAANSPQTVRVKTGYPTVGKFFFKVALMIRFNCTGSVIAADYKKPAIVLVAAHCLFGNLGKITYKTEDWSFAPGWHNNKAPFGTWTFTKGYYPASWPFNCILTHCDFNPRYDFALLVVKKLNGKHIGTVTGYDGWHIDEPRTISVTIAGIPGNSSETLLSRTVEHTVDPGGVLARKASTPGFGDGSSGGPWFYKYFNKLKFGNELGDSGGYQNGGNSDSPSYSPFWKTNFSDFIAAVSKVDNVK